MNKTPALLTPLPQRIPLRSTLPNSNKTDTVKRAIELPRRVPLKAYRSQVKLTPALPKRILMEGIANSEHSNGAPSHSGMYPTPNYRYSRTQAKKETKQENKEFDILRKRLNFDEDGLSSFQSCNGDVNVQDDNLIIQEYNQSPALNTSPHNISDLNKIGSDLVEFQKSDKSRLDESISCPFEERELLISKCHPILIKLRKLVEEGNANKSNIFEDINHLLTLWDAKLMKSTEVCVNMMYFSEKVRMKIKQLQDLDSTIHSLSTTMIVEAASVKSVGNITNQSITKSPWTTKTIAKHFEQKIIPSGNISILSKSKSMTFAKETSGDKEKVEVCPVSAMSHDTLKVHTYLKEDGETVVGSNNSIYPTTPVSSKSALRDLYSETRDARLFNDSGEEETNSKKPMSPTL